MSSFGNKAVDRTEAPRNSLPPLSLVFKNTERYTQNRVVVDDTLSAACYTDFSSQLLSPIQFNPIDNFLPLAIVERVLWRNNNNVLCAFQLKTIERSVDVSMLRIWCAGISPRQKLIDTQFEIELENERQTCTYWVYTHKLLSWYSDTVKDFDPFVVDISSEVILKKYWRAQVRRKRHHVCERDATREQW